MTEKEVIKRSSDVQRSFVVLFAGARRRSWSGKVVIRTCFSFAPADPRTPAWASFLPRKQSTPDLGKLRIYHHPDFPKSFFLSFSFHPSTVYGVSLVRTSIRKLPGYQYKQSRVSKTRP
jgi:hypothetical protein